MERSSTAIQLRSIVNFLSAPQSLLWKNRPALRIIYSTFSNRPTTRPQDNMPARHDLCSTISRAAVLFRSLSAAPDFICEHCWDGLFPGPERSEELRERLRAIAAEKGSHYLHRLLRRMDAAAAAKIHAHDLPKLIRAIEVCLLSPAAPDRTMGSRTR